MPERTTGGRFWRGDAVGSVDNLGAGVGAETTEDVSSREWKLAAGEAAITVRKEASEAEEAEDKDS